GLLVEERRCRRDLVVVDALALLDVPVDVLGHQAQHRRVGFVGRVTLIEVVERVASADVERAAERLGCNPGDGRAGQSTGEGDRARDLPQASPATRPAGEHRPPDEGRADLDVDAHAPLSEANPPGADPPGAGSASERSTPRMSACKPGATCSATARTPSWLTS